MSNYQSPLSMGVLLLGAFVGAMASSSAQAGEMSTTTDAIAAPGQILATSTRDGGIPAARKFSADKNFSLKANPNGAWSYLVAGQLLSTAVKQCEPQTKLLCWWNNMQVPNSAVVGANKTGAAISFLTVVLPAHYLILDPESNANVSVQWTAPTAGTAVVHGNFLDVDTSNVSHTAAILHNGAVLKTFTISTYQKKLTFRLRVGIEAGDTISFESDTNGYTNILTGLQAAIKLK